MNQICTIIGLCGRAQSGKNTCADIITELFDDAVQFAIADPLKYEVATAFHIDDDYFYSNNLKETPTFNLAIHRCEDQNFINLSKQLGIDIYIPQSPRRIMQLWGAEYRRSQNPNYWLDMAIDYIHKLIAIGSKKIIITDVRFPNEANALKQCGADIVMIHRSTNRNPAPEHESENIAALTPWIDHVIHNRGTVEEFAMDIKDFLNKKLLNKEKNNG